MWWWLSLALALEPALSDAVAVGDCDRLRAAIPNPSAPDERLALALCAAVDDPTTADTLLAGMAASPSLTAGTSALVLADYGRAVHADVLLRLGHPADALARLDGLTLRGEAGRRVRLTRGRALIALGRSLDARPDLQALLETPAKDEARFVLAEGALSRQDRAAAESALWRVWADNVQGGWSEAAAASLQALGHTVPDLSSERGVQLTSERVEALKRGQRHAEALDLLLALRRAQGITTEDAALGRSYFQARRYTDAVRIWEALYGPPESASGPPDALFDLALAASRLGDHARASGWYRRLIQLHPASESAEHASYKQGFLQFDKGDCEAAIRAFRDHLARYPSSLDLESALWFSGWCAWRLDRRDEADAHWGRLLAARPGTNLSAQIAYWRARARGLAGDGNAERAAMLDLVQRYPTSGAAWFASQGIGMTFPTRPRASRPPLPPGLASTEAARRAEALLSVGLRGWAAEEAKALIPAARDLGRDATIAAAWMLIAADAFDVGRGLVTGWCPSPRADADPTLLQACWPLAEGGIVARAAARYPLDPLLPYAIMQAESAFDPSVTSAAGARGLMQIMPAEGDRLHAEALGAGVFRADRLYLAPYNALLGTTELGLKATSLGAVLRPSGTPAIIASYNAGEEAVRRWLGESTAPVDADRFAEDIPYTETRRYVRTVLGNLMAWRWVYGDPARGG